jgi:hypothetical protein
MPRQLLVIGFLAAIALSSIIGAQSFAVGSPATPDSALWYGSPAAPDSISWVGAPATPDSISWVGAPVTPASGVLTAPGAPVPDV